MQIIVEDNYENFSKRDALFLQRRIQEKPNIVLGLATGKTPLGMYRELCSMNLDLTQASSFNLDEYIGSSDYHSYMQENFFSKTNIKNTFFPQENNLEKYEDMIKQRGGIDIQVLGIGRNGHIGFNEPGSSFLSKTRDRKSVV